MAWQLCRVVNVVVWDSLITVETGLSIILSSHGSFSFVLPCAFLVANKTRFKVFILKQFLLATLTIGYAGYFRKYFAAQE